MTSESLSVCPTSITKEVWDVYGAEIVAIENATYEAARRLSYAEMEHLVVDPMGVVLLAFVAGRIAGFIFAGPLERYTKVDGILQDSEYGKQTTLYSIDTTVAPSFRRRGIGHLLKRRLMDVARASGYRYISGRNRIRLADEMIALNLSLGAALLFEIYDTYRDGIDPDRCIYYRLDLSDEPQ